MFLSLALHFYWRCFLGEARENPAASLPPFPLLLCVVFGKVGCSKTTLILICLFFSGMQKKKSLPKVASFVHTTPRPSVNEYVSTNSTCVGDFKRQVIYFTDLREKVQVIELRCLFPETLALFVNCHGTTLASHDWFSQVFLCSILEFVRSGHTSASFNPSITLRGQHYDPHIIDAETRSITRPLSQATVSLTSIIKHPIT